MKIDIRSYYWPKTPDLREIKIFIDEKEVSSHFVSKNQIAELSKQFNEMGLYLSGVISHMG